jgi:hypothetical protein
MVPLGARINLGPKVIKRVAVADRRLVDREAHYRLSPPTVVTPAAPDTANLLPRGPGVRLAEQPTQPRRVKYGASGTLILGVVPPVEPLAAPISVTLAPAPTQPRRPQSRLGTPRVVHVKPINFGPGVRLAPQPIQARKAHPRLAPPAVVTPFVEPLARPIDITLVRIRPFPTDASVFKPAVINEAVPGPQGGIGIWLAPSFRGRPKSRLAPPAVVTQAVVQVFFGPKVKLSPSTRGLAKSKLPSVIYPARAYAGIAGYLTPPLDRVPSTISRLAPPAVLAAVELPRPIEVTLVRIRPPRTIARLLPVPAAFQPVGFLNVTLAPSKRGIPKSILRKPTDLVDRQDQGEVRVTLAYSVRGRPQSILRKPTDTKGLEDQGEIRVTLTRIRPVPTRSILREPTRVGVLADHARAVLVSLAYSSRGAPKSVLRKPTDLVDRQDQGRVKVTLVRIRPVPTRYFLNPPTDLVDRQDQGEIRVTLAYSLRGKPKSFLRQPVDTVGLEDQGRVKITLVRIRPVPTATALRPPTVIDLTPQTKYLSVNLAYSLRGKPKSILRAPPAFVPVPKAELDLRVTLAYSLRGKAKYVLGKPVVIDLTPQVFYLGVNLVRIRPPRTTAFYTGVVVAAETAEPISVTLAYQSRGKPKSKLRPPIDLVDREDLGEVKVTLSPQSRGRAKSRLFGIVYEARVYAPISVTLAPSTRGKTLSGLGRPFVVRAPAPYTLFGPMVQYVASPRQGRASHWKLGAPTVIGPPAAFFGPTVTLVRIRPPRTMWLLRAAVVVDDICFGTVVGFDFGPDVCGTDSSATIDGSESASTVSGSDSGATATGASAAGGSVTGGDEKTEGC